MANSPAQNLSTVALYVKSTASAFNVSTSGATQLSVDSVGNLIMNSTASSFEADFSNANPLLRTWHVTTTPNSNSLVGVHPSGNSTVSSWIATSNSNVLATSYAVIEANASNIRIASDVQGLASYLPLTMMTSGREQLRVDVNGNVGIGSSAPVFKLDVTGAIRATGNINVGGSLVFSDGSVITPATLNTSIFDYTGNGVTTTFSTGNYFATSTVATNVYIQGVYQRKNQYSWVGTNIIFNSAPPVGTAIEILVNTLANSINVPSAGTVTPAALSTGGPGWDTNGNLSVLGVTYTNGLISNINVGIGSSSPVVALDVFGSTNISGNLKVLGVATLSNPSINGNTTVGGNLLVSGSNTQINSANTTIQGNLLIGSNLVVNGSNTQINSANTTIVGNLLIGSNLVVNGSNTQINSANTTIGGNLIVNSVNTNINSNNAYVNGNLNLSTGNLNLTGLGQRITGDFSNATATSRVMFQSSTANGNTGVIAIPNGAGTDAAWRVYNANDPSNASFADIGITTGAAYIRSLASGSGTVIPLTFTVGSSERMRLTTTGNLQIGATTQTINPTAVEVINNLNGGGTEWVNNNNGGGNVSALSTGGLAFGTFTGGVGSEIVTERMRIDASGNMGIGLSNPSVKLQLYNASADTATYVTSGSVTTTVTASNTNANGQIGTTTSNPLLLLSGGTERMRITSTGNIGIGTTVTTVYDGQASGRPLVAAAASSSTTAGASTAALAVFNTDQTAENFAQINFGGLTPNNTNLYSSAIIAASVGPRVSGQYPTGNLVFMTSTTINFAPTEKLRITSQGNVGIGSSTPVQLLDVAGNVNVVGTLIMGSSFLRNRLINGGMQVAQYGTSAAPTVANFTYSMDRFFCAINSGTSGYTVTQLSQANTGLSGFYNALRYQRNSGQTNTTTMAFGQTIETANCYDLAGQTVTLSFWARAGANFSAASSQITARVATGTGTDQGSAGAYNGTWTGYAQTNTVVTITTSWVRYSIAVTIPSGVNEIQILFYWAGVGTAGTNDYADFTGIQFEPGPVATPFERKLYDQVLIDCQRYYYRHTSSGSFTQFGVGVCTSTTAILVNVPLPVTMRVPPTAIDYAAVGNFVVFDGVANTTLTGISLSYVGQNSAGVSGTVASGLTQTRPAMFEANGASTAYIGFNAEL